MMRLDRRSFLKSSLAAGAATALPALAGGPAQAQQTVRLRATWWGSQDRAQRTLAVAELFTKSHPGISIIGEPVGGDAYWPKLATQMAGRNIPDVFQLEPNTLPDYSGRGACLDLTKFLPKPLDIEGFGQRMVDLGRVYDNLYGVALGLNSFSMFYDTAMFEKAGLPAPTPDTTWEDYARLVTELNKAVGRPGEYWASPDGSRYHYVFQVWLGQRGKTTFSEDGGIGFTVDDIKEFYTYWQGLREKKVIVPADVASVDDNSIQNNCLALGKSAIGFTYSNQLVGYQLLIKNKLGIAMVPQAGKGAPSGHFYRPALIWSIGASCKNPEAAAEFISFFVNDIEAGKILGVERGVPMSPKVREAILPNLNPTEQATVAYVNMLEDRVMDYPPPAPIGANEYDRNVFRPVADQLAYGKLTVAEAAEKLVEDAKAVLRKR